MTAAATPASPEGATTAQQAEAGGLRRTMGLRQLVANGMIFIGPAAPVALFGVVYAESHGAVASVYVAATLVMALTAVSYAQMSSAVPKAGSVYSYASAGINPSAGFIAGWMVLLDYLLIPSVAFLFTGLAMHSFVPGIPVWVFTAVAVAVTTALNLAGVKSLAFAAMVVAALETVVLLAVLVGALIVIARQGTSQPVLSPFTGIGGFSLTAVVGTVSVAALSYLGFDAIATFAEETAGTSKVVGRALLVCLVTAGVLFLAQTYVMQLLTTVSPSHLAAHPDQQGTTYYDVTRTQVAPWLSTLLGVVKAAGSAFSGMVALAAGGRVVMAMARDRRLPRVFSRVTARTGAPTSATVLVTAVTLVLAVWAARKSDGLDLLSSTVSIGALSAFVLLHASVVAYFVVRRRSTRYVVHLVVPVLGVACLVPIIALANENALVVGGCWLVVGLIVLLVQHRVARRRSMTPSDGRASA
jgi:amino acid transporter